MLEMKEAMRKTDMTRIKEQRSEKERERTFSLNSINLWMNNFISFRRNHVLLLASYTHTFVYIPMHFHTSIHSGTSAPRTMCRSHVCRQREFIDAPQISCRTRSARRPHALFPLHFFINPFSPKSLFGKNIDWVCRGSYEY